MGGIFHIQMVHLFDCTTADRWASTRDGSDLKREVPPAISPLGKTCIHGQEMGRDRDPGNARGNKS